MEQNFIIGSVNSFHGGGELKSVGNINRHNDDRDVIICDVDGVILQWQEKAVGFCNMFGWPTEVAHEMQSSEDIRQPFPETHQMRLYNNSIYMKSLSYYKDVSKFIKVLDGKFRLIFATKLSVTEFSLQNRAINLRNVLNGCGYYDEFDILSCDVASTKFDMFEYIRCNLHHNIAGYIDDQAINIEHAYEVFSKGNQAQDCKYIHVIRGKRNPCKISDVVMVGSLGQLDGIFGEHCE